MWVLADVLEIPSIFKCWFGNYITDLWTVTTLAHLLATLAPNSRIDKMTNIWNHVSECLPESVAKGTNVFSLICFSFFSGASLVCLEMISPACPTAFIPTNLLDHALKQRASVQCHAQGNTGKTAQRVQQKQMCTRARATKTICLTTLKTLAKAWQEGGVIYGHQILVSPFAPAPVGPCGALPHTLPGPLQSGV